TAQASLRTRRPGSLTASASNSPSRYAPSGRMDTPSSSSSSRARVSSAASPGSVLPPGWMKTAEPRLRTSSTRPLSSRITAATVRIGGRASGRASAGVLIDGRRGRVEGALEQLEDAPVLVEPGVGADVAVAFQRIGSQLPVVLAQLDQLLRQHHRVTVEDVVVDHAVGDQQVVLQAFGIFD